MQPAYEKVPLTGERLYLFWVRAEPRFAFRLHYHPEYELTLITRGRGTRIVGDHVGDYREGDLVLLGPDVPHTWSSAAATAGGSPPANEAFVLQFSAALFGEPFLHQPDMVNLADLFQRSRRGLVFHGRTRDEAERLMRDSHAMLGLMRFARLFELFDVLGRSSEASPLAAADTGSRPRLWRSSRMERVYQYIHAHSADRLGLDAVARRFNMTPSTLHRNLKKATNRSLTELVNELRISHACGLLTHTELSIAEICYRCGYHNLSYFNRRFLKFKRMTPRAYRRRLLNSEVRREKQPSRTKDEVSS
jgi:AraC-like DNA-binding protein